MNISQGHSKGGPALSPGARRRARERALGLCYEAETKDLSFAELLAELPAPPDPYAAALFSGVGAKRAEIDELIDSHSMGWALDRLSAVDRQILRLSTFELIGEPDVPLAVIIDEAVELAKEFSTEESGRFVNGVLSAIAEVVRADRIDK